MQQNVEVLNQTAHFEESSFYGAPPPITQEADELKEPTEYFFSDSVRQLEDSRVDNQLIGMKVGDSIADEILDNLKP